MRYAIIDRKTNIVVNVIEAPRDWEVAEGLEPIPTETGSPGDHWDGKGFTPPESPRKELSRQELYAATTTEAERLDVIATDLGFKEK